MHHHPRALQQISCHLGDLDPLFTPLCLGSNVPTHQFAFKIPGYAVHSTCSCLSHVNALLISSRGTPAFTNEPMSSKKIRLYLPKREELLFLESDSTPKFALHMELLKISCVSLVSQSLPLNCQLRKASSSSQHFQRTLG